MYIVDLEYNYRTRLKAIVGFVLETFIQLRPLVLTKKFAVLHRMFWMVIFVLAGAILSKAY